jgi:rSAM/selenodomain-associated transferase 1
MPTRADALAIMAKAPVAGSVKTRLVPPLTAEQAADLYRALLLDQFEHLQQVSDAARYLFYAPAGAEQALRQLAGDRYIYRAQCDGDLGARMAQVFAELGGLGHRNVVLIGSDLPALPMAIVEKAFMLLAAEEHHVVLGPSQDGGYYLIGMNRPAPEIFTDMIWSHERVLVETTARLDRLGISYSLLPTWFDLDRAEDFQRLIALTDRASRAALSRTTAYLQSLGYWPASKV